MIEKWFLVITEQCVYRCLSCRKIIDTPGSMDPLFTHLVRYHLGALAIARADERDKARAAAA